MVGLSVKGVNGDVKLVANIGEKDIPLIVDRETFIMLLKIGHPSINLDVDDETFFELLKRLGVKFGEA